MAEKTGPIKKISDKSTKQEMLEAYQSLAKQLEEQGRKTTNEKAER